MEVKNIFRLYNTLSRDIEDFVPLNGKKVGIYACGPTVYDYTHIGHIRKYVMDDCLVRLLRYLGYQVTHVMNITDVGHLTSDADTGEDKIEKGAQREGKSAREIARFYEQYFFATMDKVLVRRPDVVSRATEHIKEQIDLIARLEARGYTYKIADGVYFDATKFPEYGRLANIRPEELRVGARVVMVEGKKHPTDFALWKLTPPGITRQMEWDSPWGKGFPGWHIECSAMSMRYLGETFEIHTGGIDHIPVHHTNEIAQSEAATGKQFVKYWVHHNFVQVEGQKMSKSLGNFITLDEVVKRGFSPLALRFLFLQTHYRQETNFTWGALKGAQKALDELNEHVKTMRIQIHMTERVTLSKEKLKRVNELRKSFKDTMRFDLNTPRAVGIIWEMVKSNLPTADKYDLLMIVNEILGLGFELIAERQMEEALPPDIKALVIARSEARHEGKYLEGDILRKKIESQGYKVEDSTSGTQVKKIPH